MATDIYLAEGTIDFPGQLSNGIGLAISFDIVQWKIYTLKYNWNIGGGLSPKRFNKAATRFQGVFKKETEVSWCL